MADEAPKQKVVIKLLKVPALDNKGKEIKDPQGEIQYKQEDMQGLFSLLNKYDSSKHPGAMKIFKALISVKDKLETCLIKETDELNLTLDEASWLKTYLNEITNNEAKDRGLAQFEIRTLVAVVAQLD